MQSPAGLLKIPEREDTYMSSFITYLKDTKAELKHVTWPTWNQVVWYTIAVLLISGIVAALLGLFDLLFSTGLQKLLGY
jgi:preprotein translocase subunit SecE